MILQTWYNNTFLLKRGYNSVAEKELNMSDSHKIQYVIPVPSGPIIAD